MKAIIVHTAIFFFYYILGAYATTDILRLLRGAVLPVNTPDCHCPVCHCRIALRDQLPVFAYLKNRGTCRSCNSKIPLTDLFLEIFLFATLSAITVVFDFSWICFGLSIVFYETVKLFFLFRFGKRENAFLKNLALSLLNNVFLFTILAFFYALEHLT